MAIVTAGSRLVTNSLFVAFLGQGTYTLKSATAARVQFPNGTATELYGDLTYTNGALSGGTLTGFADFWEDGSLHYRFSGLTYDVPRLLSLQGETAGSVLYRELYAGNDSIAGGESATAYDAVASHDGDDTVAVGAGDDAVVAGAGNDSVSGGAGKDVLFGDDGNDILTGDAGDDSVLGGRGDDTVYGFDGNDNLTADEGNDVMNGNQGMDTLWGADGGDDLRGGRDNDVLYGGEGSDPLLNGNIGNDLVYGGNGGDSLWGGQNEDHLFGEAGDDWMSGDLGADTLTGGTGADRFVFREGVGSDVIADFNFAEGDRIVIALGQNVVSVADSAAGAVLDVGQGATVTFAGFQAAQVSGEWITYG